MLYFFYLLLIYLILVFFLSRLVIPHMGFGKDPVPEILPKSLEGKIAELKDSAGSPREFLNLSYDYLGTKNWSERFNTFLKFGLLFKDLDYIWNKDGYIPCTQSTYLMRIFLLKSGYFAEHDVRRRYVFVNFIIHQYLEVRHDEKWFSVDVGEKKNGLPLGKHLKYFG